MAQLIEWSCGECGGVQAMNAETNRVLQASGTTFYCVHGHARHYPKGKSVEETLRQQIDHERRLRQRAEQNTAMWQDDARTAREQVRHERARANGYKGHATRITNRAKAGVCPCCNRHFVALERHMTTQHPDFTPLELETP